MLSDTHASRYAQNLTSLTIKETNSDIVIEYNFFNEIKKIAIFVAYFFFWSEWNSALNFF